MLFGRATKNVSNRTVLPVCSFKNSCNYRSFRIIGVMTLAFRRVRFILKVFLNCKLNKSPMNNNFSTALPAAAAKRNTMVAVLQMQSTQSKEENRDQALNLIERAKSRGAKVLFLPECFDFVAQSREIVASAAEPLDGKTIAFYRSVASDKNVWLSLGGFHERPVDFDADSRIYNTHVMINNKGDICGLYRKTHLFDVDIKGGVRLKETDHTRPGCTIGPPIKTPAGHVGLAICYDLRFPELSQALVLQGADILTFPSAFTVPTGMAHWHALLRSRAIENQCYVIAAAQVGKHNDKRSSYGHALIADPWGCVVAECSNQPGFALAEIDLEYMARVRREMPVQEHRRSDLYGTLTVPTALETGNDSIDSTQSYTFGQVQVPASAVFHRTQLSYAFVNRKPLVAGHVLIAPIRVALRFSDLTNQEMADMWSTAQKVGNMLERCYDVKALNFSVQDGAEAGQTINHVHIHVLPRKAGDFKRNDDVYHELQEHDSQVTQGEWRTDDDMAVEATSYRNMLANV